MPARWKKKPRVRASGVGAPGALRRRILQRVVGRMLRRMIGDAKAFAHGDVVSPFFRMRQAIICRPRRGMLCATMPTRAARVSDSIAMCASLVLAISAAAAAQEPVLLNVPYTCQDGVTRIITRCEKNARAEVCFWREEQNGQ